MVFIIQARSGSSRLPNKMMIPFYDGKTIPEIIISRLKETFPNDEIVIATTDNEKDDALASNLQKCGVKIFRGSESDVLTRFIDCGQFYNINTFVRICADNPFLDMVLLNDLINAWSDGLDYLAHQIQGKPSMKTGFGFFAEISTMTALRKVYHSTEEALYREHVTNYIYGNPDKFNVKFIGVDSLIGDIEGLRLTVDTENDFSTASDIFHQLAKSKRNFTYRDIIDLVNQVDLIGKMKAEGERNQK
jgi:spore coat polysaccharide biosynthesis protein SpsF (cytidylyltransferase family)